MSFGPAGWSAPYNVSPAWFNGGPLRMPPFEVEDLEQSLVVGTDAEGSTVLWRPWRSGSLPRAVSRMRFTFKLENANEDDYHLFELAKSKAQPVWLVIGMRMSDTFDVSDGDTVTITRPRAAGEALGDVTEITHPTKFFDGGSLISAPGSWSTSQSFTVSGFDGELQIAYTPAFRVFVSSMPHSAPGWNWVDNNVTLEEVSQV